MPALVPAIQPWAAFTGDYTLSSDLETMTIGASPAQAVRSPWYDMGNGATLARIQWDGTATGTIRGRSSAARPDRTDDLCPIQPGDSEWAYKFDASLGAPDSQGWAQTGSITETPVGGAMRFESSGSAYYAINPASALNATDDLSVTRIGVTLNAGHVGSFSILVINGSRSHKLTMTGSAFGSDANKLSVNDAYYIPNLTLTTGTAFDYLIVVRRSSGTVTDCRLFVKPRGSADRYAVSGFTDYGQLPTSADAQKLVLFGSFSGSGMDVTIDYVGTYTGTEWETVTDGDTSFTTNRQYWQAKGWENGTLTELDIASDLAAPGNPSGSEAAAVGASAIGGNCTSTASGASAYYAECLDADNADAVVQADWVLTPCATFRGLTVPGNYKVRFTSASDDGVRGNSAATTSSTAVPAQAATVALVLSDTTVAPGETATITPTITAATVTLDGASLSNGVPVNAVSGVSGVQTPPTIGPYPRWVDGELRFYKPTAGTNSLTGGTYKVLSSSQASGAYSVVDTTNWASITWRATDGTGEYVTATDLGLTVSDTTWYRDRITDSGNLVAEGQTAAYGGDEDTTLCQVSFSGLTAGTIVACSLSATVEVNGTTFARGPYSATVANDGTATLSLPRCDAGTNQEGDGRVFGIFTGGSPDAFVLWRRVPDTPAATFASLESP